ncbi:hypothetical protein PMAYCL1PPCAC_20246, partial [Pristionchus mayeri]
QAIYPLTSSHIPLALCIVPPIFGIGPYTWVAVVTPLSCASHPLLDPIFFIAFLEDFRNAFLHGLCMCRRNSNVTEVSVKSTELTEK